MTSTRTRRLLGGGITLAVLVVAGLAYAAWTTNGSGDGYAEAGTAQNLATNDASGATVADLYPGANGDVKLEIVNPNAYAVRVTSVSGNGAVTASGGIGTCNTTGVTFTNQTGLTIDVPANDTEVATLNDAASMSNASENGCQGATFTIPVSLSGASTAP